MEGWGPSKQLTIQHYTGKRANGQTIQDHIQYTRCWLILWKIQQGNILGLESHFILFYFIFSFSRQGLWEPFYNTLKSKRWPGPQFLAPQFCNVFFNNCFFHQVSEFFENKHCLHQILKVWHLQITAVARQAYVGYQLRRWRVGSLSLGVWDELGQYGKTPTSSKAFCNLWDDSNLQYVGMKKGKD